LVFSFSLSCESTELRQGVIFFPFYNLPLLFPLPFAWTDVIPLRLRLPLCVNNEIRRRFTRDHLTARYLSFHLDQFPSSLFFPKAFLYKPIRRAREKRLRTGSVSFPIPWETVRTQISRPCALPPPVRYRFFDEKTYPSERFDHPLSCQRC